MPGNLDIHYQNIEMKCKGDKQVRKVCCTLQCSKESFHCQDYECSSCKNKHSYCYIFEYSKMVEMINSKIQSNKKFIRQFLDLEKSIMAKFAQIKSSLNQQMQFGWLEKKYVEMLQQIYIKKNPSFLKGKQAYQLCQALKKAYRIQQKDSKIKNILQDFIQSSNKMIEEYQKLKSETIVSIINIQNRNINSKILEKYSDTILLKSWLNHPKKVQLVFRASQHAFQSSRFHQICDSIPHTLVLIKTQFNKIIGGYTPIRWDTSINNYATDNAGQTFIFSLNLKQKMSLVNSQYAIYCNSTFGPIFGAGSDIRVSNQCHLNNQSFSNFPYSYNHNLQYSNGQPAYTSFCGAAAGYNFKVLEYQVFKVSWI